MGIYCLITGCNGNNSNSSIAANVGNNGTDDTTEENVGSEGVTEENVGSNAARRKRRSAGGQQVDAPHIDLFVNPARTNELEELQAKARYREN